MVSNFLDTFGTKERRGIRGRTNALVDLLEEWSAQYSSIRSTRIPTASLVTATVVPRMSLDDSLLVAQMMLWIFGVDDKADERVFTLNEMKHKTEQWCLIANKGTNKVIDDGDEFATMLLDMRRELSISHLFDPLREYWTSRLRLLIETMATEYQYGLQYSAHGSQALPSLDEYLHNGTHSIGLPFWQSTVLVIMRDSSVMECFEHLDKTITCAGTTIRLYNDVRTLDKEIQESGVNSIIIMHHAILDKHPNITKERAWSEARQQILQLADSYAQRCYDLVGQMRTDSGQVEETIFRLIAFHAYFYGRSKYDYHTASLAETHKMLGGDVS